MAAFHLHVANGKRHVERFAKRPATVGPSFRAGNKAVTHMRSRQRKTQNRTQAGQKMEENRGIEPAAQTNPHAGLISPSDRRQLSPACRDAGEKIN